MLNSIKKCYTIRSTYLYKRTSYTLRDTIIVFIGMMKQSISIVKEIKRYGGEK